MIVKLNILGLMLLQEVGFDVVSMWKQMGWLARAVVIILGVMSAWSIGVMIDRALSFSSARKQSREFAPAVAGCLKEGKVEEASVLPSRIIEATWQRSLKPACRNSERTACPMN
jgi:biopolymer transport protein ExbB/biopolymer transport protein TolQ